jgi:hypothetical protein
METGSRRRRMTVSDTDGDNPREMMRELIERTEGRAQLEVLRDVYTDRLHRRSSDFDATRGLRLVIEKLQRTSYGSPVLTTSS